MTYMPERGSVNTKSQFLTTRITIQRHPIHPKFQYSRIYQPNKRETYRTNTSGNAQECSREIYTQTEELYDVTDKYPYVEPIAETGSEQPSNSPTNPRRSKYKLRHNPKPNCNDDYR